MKELRSKTALSVQQQADPSCKISFVCRGNLICMRYAPSHREAFLAPFLLLVLASTLFNISCLGSSAMFYSNIVASYQLQLFSSYTQKQEFNLYHINGYELHLIYVELVTLSFVH